MSVVFYTQRIMKAYETLLQGKHCIMFNMGSGLPPITPNDPRNDAKGLANRLLNSPLLAAQIASANRLDKKQKTTKDLDDKPVMPDVFLSVNDQFERLSGISKDYGANAPK